MPKKITRWNSVLARRPTMPSVTLPIDMPRARMLTTKEPKSWTHPTNSAPSTTQSIAGAQPQITATAGPSIGDRPVIEA